MKGNKYLNLVRTLVLPFFARTSEFRENLGAEFCEY